MLVLSWADYSYVQPASSVAYGVVALLGYSVLRETVTRDALGRDRDHLRGRVHRGAHVAANDGVLMLFRETIFYLLIVVAGTGGELCVTRAMKTIGEVTDFRPMSLVRVVFRAMKVGWMWLGIGQMTLAFFALLGMLSLENVSLVIPVTRAELCLWSAGRKILSRRARHAAAMGRSAAGLRRRHAGLHRQRIVACLAAS